MLSATIAGQSMTPFLSLYAQNLGMSTGAIGVFISVLGTAALLASLFTASWLGRLGPRRLALSASLVSAGALLTVGVLRSPIVFMLVLPMYSAVGPALAIASQMLVITRAGARGRDAAVGMHTFYASLGNTIGPLAGSVVVHATGHISSAFLIAAAASTAAAGVAYSVPRGDRIEVARAASFADGARAASGQARIALVAIMIAEFSYIAWATFFPLALRAEGRSPAVIGLVYSVYGVMISVVRPLLPRVAARLSRVGVMAASFLLYGAALGLAAVPVSTPLILSSAILEGVAVGLVYPITIILVTQDAEEKRVGGLLAARFTSMMTGDVAGPFLTGLFAGYSLTAALGGVGGLCVATGIWIVWRGRRTSREFLDTRKSAMLP
jgi:MFS family permease